MSRQTPFIQPISHSCLQDCNFCLDLGFKRSVNSREHKQNLQVAKSFKAPSMLFPCNVAFHPQRATILNLTKQEGLIPHILLNDSYLDASWAEQIQQWNQEGIHFTLLISQSSTEKIQEVIKLIPKEALYQIWILIHKKSSQKLFEAIPVELHPQVRWIAPRSLHSKITPFTIKKLLKTVNDFPDLQSPEGFETAPLNRLRGRPLKKPSVYKNEDKRFSVIINHYTQKDKLLKTLNSLKSGGDSSIEIIITDGSNDKSIYNKILELKNEFNASLKHLPFHNDPQNYLYPYGKALNQGAMFASAYYLLFLESGDTLHDFKALSSKTINNRAYLLGVNNTPDETRWLLPREMFLFSGGFSESYHHKILETESLKDKLEKQNGLKVFTIKNAITRAAYKNSPGVFKSRHKKAALSHYDFFIRDHLEWVQNRPQDLNQLRKRVLSSLSSQPYIR